MKDSCPPVFSHDGSEKPYGAETTFSSEGEKNQCILALRKNRRKLKKKLPLFKLCAK